MPGTTRRRGGRPSGCRNGGDRPGDPDKSLGNNEGTLSAVGGALWDAIATGVEEIEGHRTLLPTVATVATDARFWRRKGTVAYGVGLFGERMTFSEMLSLFHCHDERVTIESVDLTTSLYERVLDGFLGAGGGGR